MTHGRRDTYGHYTAHARGALVPLLDDEVCRWLWAHLREAFPDALAAILMPDHVHLITRFFEEARRRLSAILGACARFFNLGELWAPIPEPHVLTTRDKVSRGVRYSGLNCSRPWHHRGRRIQLVPDPLMWKWSTLRDSIGAIAEPWVPMSRLAEALGQPVGEDVAERFHRYVSKDSHVAVDGTPFPVRAPTTTVPTLPLGAVAKAAVACVRGVAEDLRRRSPVRRIFAALARDQGWRQSSLIADVCGIHVQNVPRLAASCPSEWLEAAALCLGDERLVVDPRELHPELTGLAEAGRRVVT